MRTHTQRFVLLLVGLTGLLAWGLGNAAAQECQTSMDCMLFVEYCAKPIGECDAPGTCVLRPENCPTYVDPVCGCDGVTYSNACVAAWFGWSVDYRGECTEPYCWSNLNCPDDEYCLFDGCAAETGVCTARPDACLDIWDPVCGCDEVTYSNACYAAMAGVTVDHEGPCDGPPCWSNLECPDDEYCLFNGCAAETGMCVPRPHACLDVWDPVCGCDEVTYSNACYAAMAGVTVDYPGPCDGAYCWSNQDCDPLWYCFFHVCAVETGLCLPRPQGCPAIWDPVCGCDGVTYSNACYAALAGMSVDYPGSCLGNECWGNSDCGEGAYCLFEPCAVETGVCTLRPTGCPDTWDPVCGCDGVTYGNACVAAAQGASVAYPGPCVWGDVNLDGSVEEGDCGAFAACVGGPGTTPERMCEAADFDGDDDVDLRDYLDFQRYYGSQPGPLLAYYGNSGCLSESDGTRFAWCDPDAFVLTPGPGTLHVAHLSAEYNCCPDDILVTLVVEGSTLRLMETEILTHPCYCICCYDVESTVVNLVPGTYTVEYCWFEYDTNQIECRTEEVVIP